MQQRPQRQSTFPRTFYRVLGVLVVLTLWGYDIVTGEITGSYPFLRMVIYEREGGARLMVYEVNRLQQAYVLEHGKFATTPSALQLDLSSQRKDATYYYEMLPQTDPQLTLVVADLGTDGEKHGYIRYRGAVKQLNPPGGKPKTVAIVCFQTRARRSWLYGAPKVPGLPFYSTQDQQLHCGEGSKVAG